MRAVEIGGDGKVLEADAAGRSPTSRPRPPAFASWSRTRSSLRPAGDSATSARTAWTVDDDFPTCGFRPRSRRLHAQDRRQDRRQGQTPRTGRKGIDLWAGPERDQVEQLRKTINAKNLLFFYRWRPQNITYLFGFRKHEQGNNAVEIPQFDPLVEAKEKEIARLRKPVPHVYELIRESEVAK